MLTESDKVLLKEILIKENPILFLGAGFSYGCKNKFGDLPMGDTLKKMIFNDFLKGEIPAGHEEEVGKATLEKTCEYVDQFGKAKELRDYLNNIFSNCEPQLFHSYMLDYPWKKIYTVNIDDVVEHIYRSKKSLVVQNMAEIKKVDDGKIEYIKLHGCVNAPDQPFIFSSSEYNKLISGQLNFKVNNLVLDIQNHPFIFVGASLDEKDIDFYVSKYEQAGYEYGRKKLIFINPYPTFDMRIRVDKFKGNIISCTTEEFLIFVHELGYSPNTIDKLRERLKYSGVFPVDTIINSLEDRVYESNLYTGYECTWEDASYGWLFSTPYLEQAKGIIDSIDWMKQARFCLALHGEGFSGKGCLLKQLAMHLEATQYEVMEYNGKSMNLDLVMDYVEQYPVEKFALIINDGAYYYKDIEKLFTYRNDKKKLLIISSSREAPHVAKRYYLEGNPYQELLITGDITHQLSESIYDKLCEKGYLGGLSRDKKKGVQSITRKRTLINFFSELTYGKGFKERLSKDVNSIMKHGKLRTFYLEIALFNIADLPYYPKELLTGRYSISFRKHHHKQEMQGPDLVVDFVSHNEQGLVLKNTLLANEIWSKAGNEQKYEVLVAILINISHYVSESENGYWRIIYETLTKLSNLQTKIKLKNMTILELYYKLKAYYQGISYYWLQLGLIEQKEDELERAQNHLLMAQTIRPNAYQIQHALARNYFIRARKTNDYAEAVEYFNIGREYMVGLIESDAYYKRKARDFSVHCFINERINFMKKFHIHPQKKDVLEMKKYLDLVVNDEDNLVDTVIVKFMHFIRREDVLYYIPRMTPQDKYFMALTSQHNKDNDDDKDIILEAY